MVKRPSASDSIFCVKNSMINIRSLAYSNNLPTLQPSLRVAGIYSHAINLYSGDRLITALPARKGLSPMAFNLTADDFEFLQDHLQPDDILASNTANGSVSNAQFTLLIQAGHCIDLKLPRFQINTIPNFGSFQNKTTGFGISIAEWLKKPQFLTLRKLLVTLAQGLPAEEEIFSQKIGQGQGLTPSFDDMIIGALLCGHGFGYDLESSRTLIRKTIQNDQQITTAVSREYLLHATEGYFSSCLLSLVKSLQQRSNDNISHRVDKLCRLGATSGVDTLAGIAAVISALTGEKKHAG